MKKKIGLLLKVEMQSGKLDTSDIIFAFFVITFGLNICKQPTWLFPVSSDRAST